MNKNTTTTTKTEYLSAFLDDETGVFEQRRMLDEVQKDNSLQQKVAHYSLIGEAMRHENSAVTVQANFLIGIHDQLETESAYTKIHVKKAANQASWLRPITGVALAASLVAVTVIAINLNKSQTPLSEASMMAQQTSESMQSTTSKIILATNSTSISKDSSSPAIAFHSLDSAWRNRLKRYVNSHTKYASTSAIMPSVRAASYASSY